jgi:protease-4
MSTFGSPPPSGPNQPQVVYVAAAPPPRSIVSKLFGFIWGVFTLLFMLAVLVAIFNPGSINEVRDKVDEHHYSGNAEGPHKIVIIEVDGTITDSEPFRKQCEYAAKDETVKAIVLRVDSPGGTVTASDQIYHQLRKLVTARKIPLVVSMGGLAASGGYYISMACGDTENVIFAEPTTWTGSIGVIIPHFDASGLLAKLAVEEDSIKSAPLKAMGSFSKKMTDEERKVLQGLVDDSFARFKDIILVGRPKLRGNDDAIKKATTGQVFSLNQAKALGLVDREGFLEDAIGRARELAGIQEDVTKVVKYRKTKSLMDTVLGAQAASSNLDFSPLLRSLTTPQAFYLYAWPSLSNEE